MRFVPRAPMFGVLACALLAGCASTKDQVIPSGGPTMLEIYRAHQMQSGVVERPGAELRRPPPPAPDKETGKIRQRGGQRRR